MNNNQTRFVALLLIITVLLGCICACGKTGEAEEKACECVECKEQIAELDARISALESQLYEMTSTTTTTTTTTATENEDTTTTTTKSAGTTKKTTGNSGTKKTTSGGQNYTPAQTTAAPKTTAAPQTTATPPVQTDPPTPTTTNNDNLGEWTDGWD